MSDHTSQESELRQFINERVEAVARHDSAALLRAHAKDVSSFPVLPPVETRGTDAVEQAFNAWLNGYSQGPHYEVHNLRVEADTELGVCSFRYHVTGKLISGDEVDMWVRATLVCRRASGGWKIVHQHESVPFDPETGQALISAAPSDD